ncbi:MAG: hypothetical protein IJK17_09865 [Lachnospiraceae bacterium]|nr:hypothetical protein [Lachnospiraceae bacterium]
MKERMTRSAFEEFKETLQRDLNSEEYPFVVSIHKNKVIAGWKTEQIPEDADSEEIRSFSVTYVLSRDKKFLGGETLLNRDVYQRPTSTEVRTYYSLSTPSSLPWRKKVDAKDWAKIGYDEDKLFSIIEHYLIEHGFTYRPGIWNHKRLGWEEGRLFRFAGILFLIVGIFLLGGFLSGSMIQDMIRTGSFLVAGIILVSTAILLPLILTIIGALLTLIGFGKMEFYDLRPEVGVKVVLGTILGSWALVALLIFLREFLLI